MKRLVILLLALAPFIAFSQGAIKTEIDWIPLEKAKKYAKKYDKNILVFFYKKNCPYCEEMKKETLSDQSVIDLINNNFFAVKIDSRTKDKIYYNNKVFGNQQPESSGRHDWRHDFYAEVARFNRNGEDLTTTPTIVLFNSKFEKINVLPGKHVKPLLLRKIKPYIK
ncbi:thioredoxin family protein [Flavobacteriales bacterium]|nr:thioredoxin family protein [Flavobacteriales bacterium]